MTWIYNNGTDFLHASDKGFYVPASDYATLGVLTMASIVAFVLFALAQYRTGRLLDRYRIKYGFDKDIELKEMDNPKNLERRENSFKRRMFKD